MRAKENYFPFISLALGLTVAILILFQIYIASEPNRIAGVMAHDSAVAVSAGQVLFQANCALCHGSSGEGTSGRPALNDKRFLDSTTDDRIFSTISSGVPNTEMPAWNQSHGGPLTDQNVTDLVAFIRAWQPNAPDRSTVPPEGDLTKGRSLYTSVCAVCHGGSGQGSGQGSALNDAAKLSQFDDAWYRDAINNGRPAQGMPTWGTVLSPQQVSDLISVIDYWRRNVPAEATPSTTTATGEEIARPSNSGGAGPAVNLTGDPQSGGQIFVDNCQKCHGPSGQGGVDNPGSDDGTIPPLNPVDETLISADPSVYAYNLDLFLEHGSTPAGTNPQQSMPAWGDENKLTPQQIADVIAYVESLNPAPPAAATAEATTEATAEATAATAATAEATTVPEGTPQATEAVEIARPSNPGGPGAAASLTGDSQTGGQLYAVYCQRCHGATGQGGVNNPGSDDAIIPPLNPIDETLINSDPQVYIYNLDLFLEHGSTPAGPNPEQSMPAWGDQGKLTPQQMADLMAYVMSLNPAPAAASEGTPQATEAVEVARPSNSGGPGAAVNLTGDPQSGGQLFVANCQRCHGTTGQGGVDNPGSDDGTIPPLNPVDETLISADAQVYAYNLDLFIEHGSTPAGTNPQESMPAWGDEGKLTPQQIADLIAYVESLNPAPPAAATTEVTPTVEATTGGTETAEVARPSNSGGAGPAVNLTGDTQPGAQIFVDNCQKCHGPSGQGGVDNPGSDDGTVPPLNPVDETLISADAQVYAYNLDLFIEHGSTPAGTNPQQTMPAWGDEGKLTPQQIADVIAYVESLNPASGAAATIEPTATPEATAEGTETAEVARPSNPGGAGPAVNLTGDPQSGAQLFVDNCQKCHGPSGQGGVDNPGSDDGTVPPVNPIDETLISADPQVYIYNLDLFIEHGSTPAGTNPQQTMPAWGDEGKLTPQQIADLIAYLMSVNPPPRGSAP